MTTQSVTLLNQFAPEDIVVIDREAESNADGFGETRAASTFRRLSDDGELREWLDTYTIGDLWEMNLIGGRP